MGKRRVHLAACQVVAYDFHMPAKKLPDSKRRTAKLPCRVSPEEIQRVRKAAKRDKQPVSAWIRQRLGL